MVSSAPAVKLCMLFYGTLENEKSDPLKQNHGDFDAQMELSASAKSDLDTRFDLPWLWLEEALKSCVLWLW